jgi:hypothetical protein
MEREKKKKKSDSFCKETFLTYVSMCKLHVYSYMFRADFAESDRNYFSNNS